MFRMSPKLAWFNQDANTTSVYTLSYDHNHSSTDTLNRVTQLLFMYLSYYIAYMLQFVYTVGSKGLKQIMPSLL